MKHLDDTEETCTHGRDPLYCDECREQEFDDYEAPTYDHSAPISPLDNFIYNNEHSEHL